MITPASRCALARLKPDDRRFAERFEMYIGGLELCNGFSELTDPAQQRERFEKELDFRKSSGNIIYPMPEKFLSTLDEIPDAAGNAVGLDRLVMLLSDSRSIDDVRMLHSGRALKSFWTLAGKCLYKLVQVPIVK